MKRFTTLFIALYLSLYLTGCTFQEKTKEQTTSVSEALSSQKNLEGFARAIQVRPFTFPDDRGPHPEFKTEWWYYTGNLESEAGRHFGYQLTFFRNALTPHNPKRTSNWATNQAYFAHFALSDIQNDTFIATERWSRGAAGLAGAQSQPFKVWLENWEIVEDGDVVRLKATHQQYAIDLKLKALKTRVLQGNKGLSQKSNLKGNASYYYSQTRLETEGKLTLPKEEIAVKGLSWLDREWSTSALGPQQEGWDWFSLQLKDGRELMLYQLRLKNGTIDPISSGSLILANGQKIHLKGSDFSIAATAHWKSPHTQTIYPSNWKIKLPAHQLDLTITPWQSDQELHQLTFKYWEGAVKVTGENIEGNGYVELTGYDGKQPTK